jgi:hypothetical protein
MNAGTCWGKNKIDPSGRRVEKPRKATFTFFFFLDFTAAFDGISNNHLFRMPNIYGYWVEFFTLKQAQYVTLANTTFKLPEDSVLTPKHVGVILI